MAKGEEKTQGSHMHMSLTLSPLTLTPSLIPSCVSGQLNFPSDPLMFPWGWGSRWDGQSF